jgi:predicted ribosome quality control (RQC) complex YloA/Tae2 family protein
VHNNYYYIRQLSGALRQKLTGWKMATCFSQEKDELILGFIREKEEYYIKAILKSDFACLVFPESFQRARKNSVDLFEDVMGLHILEVIQYQNERSFSLVLENEYSLLFKMHGNRSNIILFRKDEAIDLFHNKLANDFSIHPNALHRPLDQSFEAFEASGYKIQPLFPTFGKPVTQFVLSQGFEKQDAAGKWKIIQDTLHLMDNPTFYITSIEDTPVLSLLPVGDVGHTTNNAVEAANLFYGAYARINTLEAEKRAARKLLEKKKSQTENYLLKTYGKLDEMEKESKNEHLANIIMANLHQIPARAEVVDLYDFYHDKQISVKLKKDLSPQKNAETYYRKSKNEKIEKDKLKESIALKEQELQQVEAHLHAIEKIELLKELRKYLKEHHLTDEKLAPTPEQLFKKTEYMGYEIWIGRNAKNNDLLTQKYAFKEDLWLHAKDVTGSHVIIKHQAGKNFPEPVIEKAAELAAYYSRMRTDSLVPVIYTSKKYVRKPKGLPEGAVVVDKEKVLMVEPKAI